MKYGQIWTNSYQILNICQIKTKSIVNHIFTGKYNKIHIKKASRRFGTISPLHYPAAPEQIVYIFIILFYFYDW